MSKRTTRKQKPKPTTKGTKRPKRTILKQSAVNIGLVGHVDTPVA